MGVKQSKHSMEVNSIPAEGGNNKDAVPDVKLNGVNEVNEDDASVTIVANGQKVSVKADDPIKEEAEAEKEEEKKENAEEETEKKETSEEEAEKKEEDAAPTEEAEKKEEETPAEGAEAAKEEEEKKGKKRDLIYDANQFVAEERRIVIDGIRSAPVVALFFS